MEDNKTFLELVEKTSPVNLSICQQAELINAINNDSCSSGRAGLSYYAYFSTGNCSDSNTRQPVSKYLPSSQRNLVLYRWRLGQSEVAVSALQVDEEKVPRKLAPRKDAARTRPTVDPTSQNECELSDTLPIDSDLTFSPFQQYACKLMEENSVLSWRIHGTDLDVIAMNDISLDGGGRFLGNSFTHMSRYVCGETVLYSCLCHMYNVQLRCGETGMCVHVRFFKQYVEPVYNQLFSSHGGSIESNESVIKKRILESLQSVNVDVVRLGDHPRYCRFSILSPDMKTAAISKMQNGRVSCQYGECRARKGHSRKVVRINEPGACPHLQRLSAHQQLWDKSAGPESDNTDDEMIISSEDESPHEDDIGYINQPQNKVTMLFNSSVTVLCKT